MMGPPDDSWGLRRYLDRHGHFLTPERLVELFRREYARGEGDLCDTIAALLMGPRRDDDPAGRSHCEPIIRSVAGRMLRAARPDDLNEFRARCYAALFEALVDGSRFWEQRFGRAFKCRCIDVGRKLRRELDRYAPLEREEDLPAGDPDFEEDTAEPLTGFEPRPWLARALRCLPRTERLVVWLHHLKGLAVESVDPEAPTVATFLGVSGRMVRKYLRRARERLAAMDRRVPC